MAAIHPLTKDACVLVVGAASRYSFRRGSLEMLLDAHGARVKRVPLMQGRDREAGDITLSRVGRTVLARLYDPARLFVCGIDAARTFLAGELSMLPLTDATDDATDPDVDEAALREKAAAQRARLDALARRMRPAIEERP